MFIGMYLNSINFMKVNRKYTQLAVSSIYPVTGTSLFEKWRQKMKIKMKCIETYIFVKLFMKCFMHRKENKIFKELN